MSEQLSVDARQFPPTGSEHSQGRTQPASVAEKARHWEPGKALSQSTSHTGGQSKLQLAWSSPASHTSLKLQEAACTVA